MFFVVAFGVFAVVGVSLIAVLMSRNSEDVKPAERDMSIYKDQMNEVDRDLERGIITEDEASSARTEVARRLLAADKRAKAETVAQNASRTTNLIGVGVVFIALLSAVGLYARLGVPGMQDMPLAVWPNKRCPNKMSL